MEYLIAIFPPVAVGVLFFFVMRLIFQADRRERRLLQEMEETYEAEHPNPENIADAQQPSKK
ncbi:hypothetical protein [Bowdeniella massiliensis]|uniref:hypothetical protein n=1 Tax=Bowdeniella massiliensis TaxID=2932264 RepID=UPI0020277227|nr:hypothetical protein [Bowdeniella massiliensis]